MATSGEFRPANGQYLPVSLRFAKADRYIDVSVIFLQEDGQIVARCKELGTSMFGDTYTEAHDAIIEAIGLHLNGLDDAGELERFCREHSITIYRQLGHLWVPTSEAEAVPV